MYNKIVLDHFQNPRNLGEMENPDATGMGASRVCGDVMTLYLKIDKDKIQKATYKTMGCGAAIASGSFLTDHLKGKTISEVQNLQKDTIVKALGGLPKIKMHCTDLALEALSRALENYKNAPGQNS